MAVPPLETLLAGVVEQSSQTIDQRVGRVGVAEHNFDVVTTVMQRARHHDLLIQQALAH